MSSLLCLTARLPVPALVAHPAAAATHEVRVEDEATDYPGALLRLTAVRRLSDSADLLAQAAAYPSLEARQDYRVEAKLGAQAALAAGLALKVACEIEFDNRPIDFFDKTDTAVAASVVLKLGRQDGK